MITALENRNFGYGSGFISPRCDRFIINIPKNASSYMVDWVLRNKWTAAVVGDACSWNLVEEVVVVLRDPLERWISGIAQYVNTYILTVCGPNGPIFPDQLPNTQCDWDISADQFVDGYNQIVERLIFDVINRFDDHVWPQHEFYENILPGVRKKFFYLDNNFNATIGSYLQLQPVKNLDTNSSRSNYNMHRLNEFFRSRLQQRPELKQRVMQAYARDYAIIDQEIKLKNPKHND